MDENILLSRIAPVVKVAVTCSLWRPAGQVLYEIRLR